MPPPLPAPALTAQQLRQYFQTSLPLTDEEFARLLTRFTLKRCKKRPFVPGGFAHNVNLASGDELDLHLSVSVQPDVDAAGAPVRLLRIWAAVVLPRSVGTVRLKSPDPLVTPRIAYSLLADPADRPRLREIVRLARRLARTEPLASLLARELLPGPNIETDAALDAALDAGLVTFYQGTSTAPMGGPDDPAAVVDAEGRVRGLTGLRVADASVFPEMLSVPVNLTVLLVAERIAVALRQPAAATPAAEG